MDSQSPATGAATQPKTPPLRTGSISWEKADDGLWVVTLEAGEDGSPFVFTPEALDALNEACDAFEKDGTTRGVLIGSDHPSVFCAGADVEAMAALASLDEAEKLVRRGQETFTRLAGLPFPTVAMIHGSCVGGGLELALACTARTATKESVTRLGLPEIKLGILPAWGGCTRLPRLIGLEKSIGLITAGRTVGASRAIRLGLVDNLVPREHLRRDGAALAAKAAGKGIRRKRRGGLRTRLLEGNPAGRALLGRLAGKAVRKGTQGRYPAPEAALRVLLQGFRASVAESLDLEAREVRTLLGGSVHANLLRLFRITRESRRPPVYATGKSAPAIRDAVVIGAGTMGAGIATLLVSKRIGVRLIDPQPEALAKAWTQIDAELARRVRRRDFTREEASLARGRMRFSTAFNGLGRADLILEAATEQRELKEKILADAAAAARPDALIATNTSSYPVAELARAVEDPARFLGLHFFNPPTRMPLLEIVHGPETSDESVARGIAFSSALGKTPVVVGDGPGFLVNRLLTPYFLDACRLAQEGVGIEKIDAALLDFGMPMGPFRLMDEIGLDVILHAGKHIAERTDGAIALHPFIEGLVDQGCLGKKSGEGFYRHGGKSRTVGSKFTRMMKEYRRPGGEPSESAHALSDRLIGRMVAEARKTLGEGLALSAEDVDIATVFGIGFPPWRGGLLHDAESGSRAPEATS